jgi:hypothetical protein
MVFIISGYRFAYKIDISWTLLCRLSGNPDHCIVNDRVPFVCSSKSKPGDNVKGE